MYYQSQDIRSSTLAISQSLKYRKTCQYNQSNSKRYNQNSSYDENFSPLFHTEIKSRNESVQMKKQSRRKSGSIGRIVRNNYSNDKKCQFKQRQPLSEANSILNSKLQYETETQNIGVYKQLYQKNKALNEALKSKIYQTPQSSSYKNSLMGLSNYQVESKTLSKITNHPVFAEQISQNKNYARDNHQKQQSSSKYESMLAEYDKKKNFIKQEILAMKQKSSLDNFSSNNLLKKSESKLNYEYNLRKNKQNQYELKDNPNSDKKYQSFSQGFGKYQHASQKKIYNQKINQQTQDEIEKKFKAYQQKIQKHREFQKRNFSVNKFSQLKESDKKQLSFEQKSLKTSSVSQSSKIGDKPMSKLITNEPIKLFSQLIMKQIQKDDQVRLLKNKLKSFPLQEIQKILKNKYSFQIDPQKIRLSPEEYDPFFQSNQNEKSLEKLVWQFFNAYEIASNFWKNLIVGKFTSQQLQKIYDSLNQSKKDKIEINEFARQISFHLKKTVRGRQIYESYRRLSPFTKQNVIQKLSKKL